MPIQRLGATNAPQTNNSETQTNERNPQVLNAARMYENQFLREMVRAMRKTIPESEFMPESYAEKIFREQMDDHTVDEWTERGGIGMADVIYDQVMDKYFNSIQPRPVGPLKVTDPIRAQTVKQSDKDLTLKLGTLQSTELVSPWSGQVIGAQSLEQGLKSVLLDHGPEHSLRSSLVFSGDLLVAEGARVSPGQKLGLLSRPDGEIIWRIKQ